MINLPNHVLQDEEICAQCSRERGGCCIINSNEASNCFPLSLPEVLRLLPYADCAEKGSSELSHSSEISQSMVTLLKRTIATTSNDFFAQEQIDISALEEVEKKVSLVVVAEINTENFLSAVQSILPQHKKKLENIFPVGEFHFRLRTLKNGACAFLGKKGCRLPRQARPWYCQSYPGWIYNGELTLFDNNECLVATSNSPLQGISKLGMIPQDIRFFYEALLRDWKITD